MYRIIIEKLEERSQEEIDRLDNGRDKYSIRDSHMFQTDEYRFKTTKHLETTLTDVEFEAVKKAVIEVM